ncbi:class I SAM-dependent methyltransferase [Actinoplanes sp. NPDC026670]|uniref:class I SAM-dependent methyltransferase n=1 Tax=Actinoplanes sp. NPDC026670 TaxID=3154700 RepID=UPI00340781D0
MVVERALVPMPDHLSSDQHDRWLTVLDHLVAALPYRGRLILVDGFDQRAGLLADRLVERLRDLGRPAVRLTGDVCTCDEDGWGNLTASAVVVADGPRWRDRLPGMNWDLSVWVRTPPNGNGAYRGDDAHAVVDLHDPGWPVIRHLDEYLAPGDHWYRTESRAFFASRAATWDRKFGADLPAYAAAIAESEVAPGGVAVDIGCGTGRALPALRAAVGPDGVVIGIDHTPQMLAEAVTRGHDCQALLLRADARHLPLPAGSVDAIFAAGLINHLPHPATGLRELARITRPGGKLILFHPSGRAALAARHGRDLHPDEVLAEPILRATAADTGWHLTRYDDGPSRFYALAIRV